MKLEIYKDDPVKDFETKLDYSKYQRFGDVFIITAPDMSHTVGDEKISYIGRSDILLSSDDIKKLSDDINKE